MNGAPTARAPAAEPPSATSGGARAPLRVGLVGMAERTRATLAWHFEHARSRRFVEVAGAERPEAVIVDADHPEALAALRAFVATASREGGPAPAILMLALGAPPPALAALAAHVVTKPVSAEALELAARALRDGSARAAPAHASGAAPPPALHVSDPAPEAAPGTAPVTAPGAARDPAATVGPAAGPTAGPAPGSPATGAPPAATGDASPAAPPAPDPRRARLREEMLCGAPGSIEAALAALERGDAAAAAALRFDPGAHLGALLGRELRLAAEAAPAGAHGLRIEMPHLELFVLPGVNRVYASETLGSVAAVRATFAPLGGGDARVTHHAGGAMRALLERVRAHARSGYTLDAFAWLCALMSSRGRLPAGLDRAAPVRLRRWPNLTRLEPVPHAIELAAHWVAAPVSIEALTRTAGVEPRFVHAFHNAASALGLFETAPPEAHRG